MGSTRNFPPHPSVEHLTTIFRRIESGKIVVPAFQRTFVWEQEDVLELLRSVFNGYPIGSVLLWAADREFLRISDAPEIPFPKSPLEFPVSYVLDGLQRLSSLYGVFHYGERTNAGIFDVSFDMVDQNFVHSSDLTMLSLPVPLNALFNPRRMLDVQRNIIENGLGDEYLSRLTDLQARFQEYMIPLVTISERDLEEVVVIFERVNSTGTKLSRVDFMRAITWSEQFDLNKALDDIRSQLEPAGFDISDDTIVKALGVMFDLDPLPDVLLALRRKSPQDLNQAAKKTVGVFLKVFEFLRDSLLIFSSEYVPYEGQMLVIFRIFRDIDKLNNSQIAALRAWFFYISFDEVLQGRPDHVVARMIRSVGAQLTNGSIDLPINIIDSERFIRRRMLKGKALTTAFITMMAGLKPLSLVMDEIIPAEELTGSYSTRNFVPILPLAEIVQVRGQLLSARTPANVLIVSPAEYSVRPEDAKRFVLAKAASTDGQEALDRQLITVDAVEALRKGNYEAFLQIRAELIASRASLVMTPL